VTERKGREWVRKVKPTIESAKKSKNRSVTGRNIVKRARIDGIRNSIARNFS
jgi:hypothetical protein